MPSGRRTARSAGDGATKQYFHGQPYGHAVDEKGNADCEDGQRGYLTSLSKFNTEPERFTVVSDPRTPGNQGPVYDQIVNGRGVGLGPRRVPKGQTFTPEADTGPRPPGTAPPDHYDPVPDADPELP